MSSAKKLMGTTAVGGALAIEDVFSTYLYRGATTNPTDIVNGIDLAGEGGMVWVKARNTVKAGVILDTHNGATKYLETDRTDAIQTFSAGYGFDGFTSTGVSSAANGNLSVNAAYNYASWTWRKAPRWFDVVTYTGTGSTRTVSHNLGVAPGVMIVKRTDTTGEWRVYHRSVGATTSLRLNTSTVGTVSNVYWNNTAPTDTVFTVRTDPDVNASGGSYVAYLFAHDPLGPSGDGSDGLIACGSYTGTGAAGNFQDLGWEPQYVLVKSASASGNWIIHDVMRGMSETTSYTLKAESSGAENLDTPGRLLPRPTGFEFSSSGLAANNASGVTYIYIAIRRGPMRQPTSGTEVFKAALHYGSSGLEQFIPSGGAGFPVDLLISASRGDSNGRYKYFINRLADMWSMTSTSTAAEVFGPGNPIANIGGYQDTIRIGAAGEISSSSWGYVDYYFRRAPSFFDVVAYTGNSTTTWYNHNLQAVPELMIVKSRSSAEDWSVYSKDRTGTSKILALNLASAEQTTLSPYDFPSTPTETQFRLGTNSRVNSSGNNYIAYLFASCPGVSKVGSYTGNGTSQTINCGFTTGARFVLIKRTDSTGHWYTFNTARGIVAGNDPWIRINNTDQEGTTDDSVDPDNSGFIVNQVAATSINVSSASYIYIAIA